MKPKLLKIVTDGVPRPPGDANRSVLSRSGALKNTPATEPSNESTTTLQPHHQLHRAAANRSLNTEQRVHKTLKALTKRGETITFASVAQHAKVSRQYLYLHTDLRDEIQTLRILQTKQPHPNRRYRKNSIEARLQAALKDNQHLRQENTQLRDELALTHGQLRELQLAKRTNRR